MGRRARERVLDEHTYRHRARQVLELVGLGGGGVKRIAIVPAFNEQDAIGRVIDELTAFDPGVDVVVIDDASHDATAERAPPSTART